MHTLWIVSAWIVSQVVTTAGDAPLAAAVSPGPDVLVVCPQQWLPVWNEWCKWREGQGRRVAILDRWSSAEEIRQTVRRVAQEGQLRWLVFVGDAPCPVRPAEQRADCVPTHYSPAERIAEFGPDHDIASDTWYADLDDDEVPDVAHGRISVENEEQLRQIVAKIRQYEACRSGDWYSRLHLTAGSGGFGPWLDGLLEWWTRKLVCQQIPVQYVTTFTYGSWQSPYCPDPRRFPAVVSQKLNEGCWFWVYMGHGQPTGLQPLLTPQRRYRMLDVADARRLDARSGWPIAVLMACYTGQFDGPEPCLAEELVRVPGGPVAAVAASRTAMPYGMALLGCYLSDECFVERRDTLGELMLYAKRRLAEDTPRGDDSLASLRQVLDQLALTVMPRTNREKLRRERKEHVALFQLLGDPLLKLPHPQPLPVEVPAEALAGDTLQVRVAAPWSGTGVVEVLSRRDTPKVNFPLRTVFDEDDELLAQYQQQYETLQDSAWLTISHSFQQGSQLVLVSLPENISGPCVLRVRLPGDHGDALGAAEFLVRPKVP